MNELEIKSELNSRYMNWIVEKLKENEGVISDECLMYKDKGVNTKNIRFISKFAYEVYKYARKNFINTMELLEDDDCTFTQFSVVLKYNDMYLHIEDLNGQGAITFIKVLEEYKGKEYVNWDDMCNATESIRAKEILGIMDSNLKNHIEAIKEFKSSNDFKELKNKYRMIDDRYISRYVIDMINNIE